VDSGTKRIVVATRNAGKLAEIRHALDFPGWHFVSMDELGAFPEVEETGETFRDNALIKAEVARERFALPALADDSGLEVDALNGEPGVLSARYAGTPSSDTENNVKLLRELEHAPEDRRAARFRCVMVLIDEDGTVIEAQGTCEGRIAVIPSGEHGFGYDPLFLPDATPGRTMAELTLEEKNAISHRGAALRALREELARG